MQLGEEVRRLMLYHQQKIELVVIVEEIEKIKRSFMQWVSSRIYSAVVIFKHVRSLCSLTGRTAPGSQIDSFTPLLTTHFYAGTSPGNFASRRS